MSRRALRPTFSLTLAAVFGKAGAGPRYLRYKGNATIAAEPSLLLPRWAREGLSPPPVGCSPNQVELQESSRQRIMCASRACPGSPVTQTRDARAPHWRELVGPMCLAAAAAGLDGVMVEVHEAATAFDVRRVPADTREPV